MIIDGRTVAIVPSAGLALLLQAKWALDHLLLGVPLEDLVDAPFGWREGWHYTVPGGWTGPLVR